MIIHGKSQETIAIVFLTWWQQHFLLREKFPSNRYNNEKQFLFLLLD